MKIKKIFLALTIIIISASPAWAENWAYVGESVGGHEHFVDADSIRKAKGFVYYWSLINRLEPSPSGTLSNKTYYKLNCDSQGSMTLTAEGYTSHMGKGKLNFSENPEPKWRYMKSGSIHGGINKIVCELVE